MVAAKAKDLVFGNRAQKADVVCVWDSRLKVEDVWLTILGSI